MSLRIAVVSVFLCVPAAFADGPADNVPENVRPVPPKGIAVPDNLRAELRAGADELGRAIEELRTNLKDNPSWLELLPDVEIYYKAVDWALRYNEFYDAKEFATARKMLTEGRDRARQIAARQAKWTIQTGLVVRGYRSKIDGSVQPYGLVVPASWSPNSPHKFRLDLWWHGRGEKLTELNFINDREKNRGEFTPADTIVLHPYGRYCNANKFAGEVDTFEAIADVRRRYHTDPDRVVARGFSMGGAACWQFATHFPSAWCAANPGAGFAETADFLKVFQNEKVQPTEWEQKLWHWYDSTDYAANLFNLPTVAYSGEIDKQKQAADMMAKAMKKEGLELVHLIGRKTAHKYEPETKKEVAKQIDALAARGRPAYPERVKFTTYTLLYDRSYWLTIDRLEKHWERADVDADRSGKITTRNVSAFTVELPDGVENTPTWLVDGQTVTTPPVKGRRRAFFHKSNGKWHDNGAPIEPHTQYKFHGVQGPIDDAFMSRFLMVRPTGTPSNEKTGAWAKGEMAHAVKAWRDQFRGEAPVKDDSAVTDADIASSNLILWGDPSSNKVLAKIADKLPIKWSAEGVRVGDKTYPAGTHVPILIYPNPLNPYRYVVLNSGFTFREYDYLNNARQVPKLPDWAVVDVTTPPSARWPGKVVDAGFFDEQWRLK